MPLLRHSRAARSRRGPGHAGGHPADRGEGVLSATASMAIVGLVAALLAPVFGANAATLGQGIEQKICQVLALVLPLDCGGTGAGTSSGGAGTSSGGAGTGSGGAGTGSGATGTGSGSAGPERSGPTGPQMPTDTPENREIIEQVVHGTLAAGPAAPLGSRDNPLALPKGYAGPPNMPHMTRDVTFQEANQAALTGARAPGPSAWSSGLRPAASGARPPARWAAAR